MSVRRVIAAMAVTVLLAACSSQSSTGPAAEIPDAVSSMRTSTLDGSGGCPPAPSSLPDTFIDIEGGSGDHATLYGLLFTAYPIPRGTVAKIAWRMTGTGDLTLSATGPAGSTIKPEWLEYHGGSSWQRPGTEWGSGLRFTEAGCWTVHARRGSAEATASLLVK